MACLMAEALDVAAENFIKTTKYEKLTALSKTLRDDASCQLCSILLKVSACGSRELLYMMSVSKGGGGS